MTRRFDAVIFDMDGVIADSVTVHETVFIDLLDSHGYQLDPELRRQVWANVPWNETWMSIQQIFEIDDIKVLEAAYDELITAAMADIHQALPGVIEVITAVGTLGLPVGLGSGSMAPWVAAVLSGLRLQDAFASVVTASDVTHAKPAPDIYLRVAAEINVPPQRCLVFEDSPSGITSAKTAGMFAVQVRSASTPFPPVDHADLVLESLLDFDLAMLSAGRPA
jgi:HAD superfamily hydrolase (TIGR01509 family)